MKERRNRRLVEFVFLSFIMILVAFEGKRDVGLIETNSTSNARLGVSPWGMNAHLTFSCSTNYVEELCKSMKDAGVDMIRLDVYWWYGNMLMQRELCDRAVYYADKYGLKILLNFPQLPNRTDQLFVEEWLGMIKYYALRYNGSNPITIKGENIERYPYVKYFEVLNEVELKYQKQGINVKDAFMLIKTSSDLLHSLHLKEKPVVIFPGISPFNSFQESLLKYREGNKSILDYVDVFNVHIYTKKTEDFIFTVKFWIKVLKKIHNGQMPIWITELGNSLWDVAEKTQEGNLIKQYLIASSFGIERIFYYQYHSFGGNFFDNIDQREEYFGIIDYGVSKSYISLLENDGSNTTPLSEGDGLKKVYAPLKNNGKVYLYTLTDLVKRKVQEDGLVIGGEKIKVYRVSIQDSSGKDDTIWLGDKTISTKNNSITQIPSYFFKNITTKDKIVVYLKKLEEGENWEGLKPLKAYYAYKHLSSIFNKDSSRPTLNNISKNQVISWQTKNKFYYVLWNDKEKDSIKIIPTKNVFLYKESEKKLISRSYLVSLGEFPILLESDEEILFNHR